MSRTPPDKPVVEAKFSLSGIAVRNIMGIIVVSHPGRKDACLSRKYPDAWYDKLIAAGYSDPEAIKILHEIS